MTEIEKALNDAYKFISLMAVSGDNQDYAVNAKLCLKRAFTLLKQESDTEGGAENG